MTFSSFSLFKKIHAYSPGWPWNESAAIRLGSVTELLVHRPFDLPHRPHSNPNWPSALNTMASGQLSTLPSSHYSLPKCIPHPPLCSHHVDLPVVTFSFGRAVFLLETQGKNLFSSQSFSASRSCRHSLTHHIASLAFASLITSQSPTLTLWLSYSLCEKDPCGYAGSTQIIWTILLSQDLYLDHIDKFLLSLWVYILSISM